MLKLVGNQKKIFKIIYKHCLNNKIINSCYFYNLDYNVDEFDDDIKYLIEQDLIFCDYNWNYKLTAKGRSYFKYRLSFWVETLIRSIFCPILVAFFTTLITLWLKDL